MYIGVNDITKSLNFYLERYRKEWEYSNKRFTNNNRSGFADDQLLTVYLYGIIAESRFRVKEIHGFAKKHLLSWFPKLPSYQTFNKWLNKAAGAPWSKAVSTVRYPIESLFNWVNQKTDLQRATKVIPTKGLWVHVYGKLATDFLLAAIFAS